MKKIQILIVCTGNTCRSPMAAYFLRHLLEDEKDREDMEVLVESAGVFALEGIPAAEHAVKVLAAEGIDLSGHRAKQLLREDVLEADLILTMTEKHKEMIIREVSEVEDKVFTLGEFSDCEGLTDISDPFGGTEDIYRQTFAELKRLLILAAQKLKTRQGLNGKNESS